MPELHRTAGELLGSTTVMGEVMQHGLTKKMAQSSHGTPLDIAGSCPTMD